VTVLNLVNEERDQGVAERLSVRMMREIVSDLRIEETKTHLGSEKSSRSRRSIKVIVHTDALGSSSTCTSSFFTSTDQTEVTNVVAESSFYGEGRVGVSAVLPVNEFIERFNVEENGCSNLKESSAKNECFEQARRAYQLCRSEKRPRRFSHSSRIPSEEP